MPAPLRSRNKARRSAFAEAGVLTTTFQKGEAELDQVVQNPRENV